MSRLPQRPDGISALEPSPAETQGNRNSPEVQNPKCRWGNVGSAVGHGISSPERGPRLKLGEIPSLARKVQRDPESDRPLVHGSGAGKLPGHENDPLILAVDVGDLGIVGEHLVSPHDKGTVTATLSGQGERGEGLVVIAGHVASVSLSE